jgi:hypothetical protein
MSGAWSAEYVLRPALRGSATIIATIAQIVSGSETVIATMAQIVAGSVTIAAPSLSHCASSASPDTSILA